MATLGMKGSGSGSAEASVTGASQLASSVGSPVLTTYVKRIPSGGLKNSERGGQRNSVQLLAAVWLLNSPTETRAEILFKFYESAAIQLS